MGHSRRMAKRNFRLAKRAQEFNESMQQQAMQFAVRQYEEGKPAFQRKLMEEAGINPFMNDAAVSPSSGVHPVNPGQVQPAQYDLSGEAAYNNSITNRLTGLASSMSQHLDNYIKGATLTEQIDKLKAETSSAVTAAWLADATKGLSHDIAVYERNYKREQALQASYKTAYDAARSLHLDEIVTNEIALLVSQVSQHYASADKMRAEIPEISSRITKNLLEANLIQSKTDAQNIQNRYLPHVLRATIDEKRSQTKLNNSSAAHMDELKEGQRITNIKMWMPKNLAEYLYLRANGGKGKYSGILRDHFSTLSELEQEKTDALTDYYSTGAINNLTDPAAELVDLTISPDFEKEQKEIRKKQNKRAQRKKNRKTEKSLKKAIPKIIKKAIFKR